MYIGPWQEYRLAKIQDDAIQRLRQEFEAQLRGQLPARDDDPIRELMQPLMAKLPSMLLAPNSRASSSTAGRLNRARSGANSEVGSRCSSRPASAQSTVSSSASVRTRTSSNGEREAGSVVRRHRKPNGENNQETHDANSSRMAARPPRPKKKGKKTPLTSLEQVQKRKKMFATWIKQAGNNASDAPEQTTPETTPEIQEAAPANVMTRLPPIHSAVPANAATLLGENARPKTPATLTLPPLSKLSVSSPLPNRASVLSPQVSTPCNAANIDLDESVDEEEINKLLNWTDTLLAPEDMDSFCDFDD